MPGASSAPGPTAGRTVTRFADKKRGGVFPHEDTDKNPDEPCPGIKQDACMVLARTQTSSDAPFRGILQPSFVIRDKPIKSSR